MFKLQRQQRIIQRLDGKFMKWTGIGEKINIAETAKEILREKHGQSAPIYGFGEDRETSYFWRNEKGFLYDENERGKK
jgi:hypothetical protein